MLEMFRDESIEAFESGEILGVCCTDACGMVSRIIMYINNKHTYFIRVLIYTTLGLSSSINCQKKIDAMVQQFGHASCDQSIQVMAILLVEKKHFSKTQIELWKTQLQYVHSAVLK